MRLGHDCEPRVPGAVSHCYQRVVLPQRGELSWLPDFIGSRLTPTPCLMY
ncbi:MAG: hypothetical protein ACOCX5_04400 [Chloroflexota bacterium]